MRNTRQKFLGFWLGFLTAMQACNPAFAALSEADKAQSVFRNLVPNPGAETGLSSMTASGGTFTRTTTAANVGSGNAAFGWDSSASGQTLTSTVATVPYGMEGKNGVLSCNVQVPSGTATHTLGVWDGSTLSNATTITSATKYTRTNVNLVLGAGGSSVGWRMTSVASNEPQIYIDDCVITTADGFNLYQVNQPQLYGTLTYVGAANCTWQTTSTSYGAYSADTDCNTATVTGGLTAPATKIPSFDMNNAPPGNYFIVASGGFGKGTTNDASAKFRFYDGTTGYNASSYYSSGTAMSGGSISAVIPYTSAGNRTISIQGVVSSGTIEANIYNNDTNTSLTIMVFRYPTSAEMAYRPNVLPAHWSGYHDKDCAWSTASTSLVNPSDDASCTFTERSNTNFGTVSSSGAKGPGITFTPTVVGKYYVCANASLENGTQNNGTIISLTDGTNVLGTAISYDGTNSLSGLPKTHAACGIYNATSTSSSVTLKLQLAAATGGTAYINNGNTTGSVAIDWNIFSLSQSFSAPALVGSVTSNSTGSERIERAKFSLSASPTTDSESGDWINGNPSRTGLGLYTMTMNTGIFSAAPTCTCNTGSGGRMCSFANGVGITSTQFGIDFRAHDGSFEDGTIWVICMGPR